MLDSTQTKPLIIYVYQPIVNSADTTDRLAPIELAKKVADTIIIFKKL